VLVENVPRGRKYEEWNRRDISFPGLLGDWGTSYNATVGVRGGAAPAENKFGAFLAPQNTSGKTMTAPLKSEKLPP